MHLLDLLADGAGLDGGHVFCLVNDGFIHYWPALLPSGVQSTVTEERKRIWRNASLRKNSKFDFILVNNSKISMFEWYGHINHFIRSKLGGEQWWNMCNQLSLKVYDATCALLLDHNNKMLAETLILLWKYSRWWVIVGLKVHFL